MKTNLVVELKSVVSGSVASQVTEDAWLESFFQEAIKSIKLDLPASQASQAVDFFLRLARQADLWTESKTPLSVRRALRKEGATEAPFITVLCRLEGRIRDRFRTTPSRRRSAATTATDAATTATDAVIADNIQAALTKGRLEGMVVMLRALSHYVRQCPEVSRLQLLDELRRAAQSIKQQLDSAA